MAGREQQLQFAVRAINEASKTLKDIQGDIDGLGTSVETANKKSGGLSKTMGDVGKIAGGFILADGLMKLPGMASDFIGLASDTTESLGKVNVVFGDNAKEIDAWSKTTAKSMGISRAQSLAAVGGFGNLFKTMGMGDRETKDMSKNVVGLAADLASFNNIAGDDALEKLRAGLVGEAEPLRALGINMNEAAVKAKGMELGLGGTNGVMTEAEKVQARYAIILDQTKTAQGDFARTSDGLANQQRIANAEIEDMKIKIGEKLQPVMLAFMRFVLDQVIPGLIKFGTFWDESVQPKIEKFIGWLVEEWGKFQGYYDDKIKPAVDSIIKGFQSIIDFVQEHWKEIEAIITPIIEQVAAVIDTNVQTILGIIDMIVALLHGDFSGAWEAAQRIVDAQVTLIVGSVGRLWDEVTALAGAALSAGKALGSALVDGIVDGISSIAGSIGEIGENIRNALRAGINNALRWLSNNVRIEIPGFDPPGPGSIPGFSWGFPLIQFARGGVVPGPRGAGDIIPAMLSPGEVVIPANVAQGGGFGGNTYVFNVSAVDASGFRRIMPQLARELVEHQRRQYGAA